MSVEPVRAVDFSTYKCAYEPLELEAYPAQVQGAVETLRTVAKSRIHYSLEQQIGKGSFADVYKTFYETPDKVVHICAVKLFPDRLLKDVEHEANMLWQVVDVTTAVGLYGVCSFRETPTAIMNAIVLEHIDAPNLFKNPLQFKGAEVVELARQLFAFLAQIQSTAPHRLNGICHFDLHRTNVIHLNGKLRIVDFNVAKEIGKFNQPIVHKEGVRAPEIILNQTSKGNGDWEAPNYTKSCEVWAVAAMIYEFITKEEFIPFYDKKRAYGFQPLAAYIVRFGLPSLNYLRTCVNSDTYFTLHEITGLELEDAETGCNMVKSMWTKLSSYPDIPLALVDLLKRCFTWDPKQRITVEAALAHSVFQPRQVT
jgi:serine/threonine protein kinase